ncbi:23S rRNA pseudouridine(2605) synthase RluB [Marinobacter halophilus]|uniref:Pseudouridine synthase n=1 Tax=Marinobacter halophilus TaxID=1323740 RepID=A0A2T1KH34_9GAMM|nr:23S rRNA pseudouridine(2605) synthase RluB [Marinobacter halophilus]PSF09435.1 23S rRNA pseudouridine(2605) synthase RluB [Marinobacter halophilus]GGC77813.1 pseudouridine synthase [Marinobacter halophilus]
MAASGPGKSGSKTKPVQDEKSLSGGPERIQKLLARAGVGSRREIEGWMEAGRLLVNSRPAEPGQKATTGDQFELDGKVLDVASAAQVVRRVLIYNKPEGEVTSRKDPEGRPTVFDRLPRLKDQRWISIGRLDINTTGLVLFTTDGELANRLMHPSSEIDREYAVRVFGDVDEAMQARLLEGVLLDDGLAKFSDISPAGGSGINRWFHVTLLEGRNREVRRLWESQGVRVSRLKRVRYGPIFLPSRLTLGKWEELQQKDVDILSKVVGLTSVDIPQKTPDEQAEHDRRSRKSPGKSLHRARKGSWQVSDSAPSKPKPKRDERKGSAGTSRPARNNRG